MSDTRKRTRDGNDNIEPSSKRARIDEYDDDSSSDYSSTESSSDSSTASTSDDSSDDSSSSSANEDSKDNEIDRYRTVIRKQYIEIKNLKDELKMFRKEEGMSVYVC